MLWTQIRGIGCTPVQLPSYGQMFLLPVPGTQSNWLIGQYKDQTRFATDLRNSPSLQDFCAANFIRLGLRDTDIPPFKKDRQERYGNTITGVNSARDFTLDRKKELALIVKDKNASINRFSDRKENVELFWATQTPQSHHIVEFNHLEELGMSKPSGAGEMDHAQLPCVLLAAEFHQRYISSILKAMHGKKKAELQKELYKVYFSLYTGRSTLFQPLWKFLK